jgi:hypothetical protein
MYTGNVYDVVIPEELSGDKVVTLSDILFQHNSFVRTVSLPDTIIKIPDYSFSDMSELRSVILPETLKEIGTAAFMNDRLLGSLEIPESVEYISDDAFVGCDSLIILAAQDSYAFNWAINAGIRVKDTSQNNFLEYSFVKPNGKVMVAGYSGINTEPELPGTNEYNEIVTGIADDAFRSLNISSITIPDGYDMIGDYSFADNPSPMTITIPRSVLSIGDNCFDGTDVIIYGFNGSYAEEYARSHRIKFLIIYEWEQ